MDAWHHLILLLLLIVVIVSLIVSSLRIHPMPSSIDSLPIDSLVQILCKLKHDELKLLRSISKSFRHAARIAQRMHFNFSTPEPKRVITFHGDVNDISAPGAPSLKLDNRRKTRIRTSKLRKQETQKIAVVLFPTNDGKVRGFPSGCNTAGKS